MRRLQTIALCIIAIIGLTQCAPATRFSWGDYESSLYVYYKSPNEREVYKKALTDAVDRGRQRNDIAPGLLAELGYLYLEDGDMVRATALFREEMQRFPESRLFLTRIIDRATGTPVARGMS